MSFYTSHLTGNVSPCLRRLHRHCSGATLRSTTTTMSTFSGSSSLTVSCYVIHHSCLLFGVWRRKVLSVVKLNVFLTLISGSASRPSPLHRQGLEGNQASGGCCHGWKNLRQPVEADTTSQRLPARPAVETTTRSAVEPAVWTKGGPEETKPLTLVGLRGEEHRPGPC